MGLNSAHHEKENISIYKYFQYGRICCSLQECYWNQLSGKKYLIPFCRSHDLKREKSEVYVLIMKGVPMIHRECGSNFRLQIISLIVLIFALPVIVFTGCSPQGKETSMVEQLKPVKVTPVTMGLMEKRLSLTGTIEPLEKAEIFSKIPGKVEKVYCREGDRVQAGQLLIQLEDDDQLAAVAQAEAALEMARARLSQAKSGVGIQATKTHTDIQQAQNSLYQAEANYKLVRTDLSRMKGLFRDGAIPRQQLDVAETNEEVSRRALDSARQNLQFARASVGQDRIREEDRHVARAGISQAEAALLTARTQLKYACIVSPVSGVVTYRGVEPGEMISASTMMRAAPLLRVVDTRQFNVEAQVPEKDICMFEEGRSVRVIIDAIKHGDVLGKITTVVPAADRQSRSFKIKVSLPNRSGLLKSGMFARIQAVSYRNSHALMIPREALMEREGKKVLFIVRQNVATMTEVKPGNNDEKNYEILSGVKSGDPVVTAGQTILNDGDKVRVEGGERQ
jgi:HlyD family secretion protein